MSDAFSEHLAAWREYAETPWARIRYAVVGEVLRRQCSALGDRLRILDVGGGDGTDALPLARAGHEVTVVDPAGSWLDEAARSAASQGVPLSTVRGGLDDLPDGEWDLVLCHFVLRYRPAEAPDLAALAGRVRPGGRLSVVDVNAPGRVLRHLVTEGPAAAAEELASVHASVEMFAQTARRVDLEEVERDAHVVGLRSVGVFGNRIANDLLADDAAKHDPAFFAELLALELALCDREPFNRIGAAWQLVLERPTDDISPGT